MRHLHTLSLLAAAVASLPAFAAAPVSITAVDNVRIGDVGRGLRVHAG
ncbi:hypothetical protein ACFFGH_17460 [Lysobacter korlensis]|uniref:Uncharacterized protein n=1 Tax=Lysobacter korlensis TaxID=553636 RepID=A0ABV6RUL5_9GAMM